PDATLPEPCDPPGWAEHKARLAVLVARSAVATIPTKARALSVQATPPVLTASKATLIFDCDSSDHDEQVTIWRQGALKLRFQQLQNKLMTTLASRSRDAGSASGGLAEETCAITFEDINVAMSVASDVMEQAQEPAQQGVETWLFTNMICLTEFAFLVADAGVSISRVESVMKSVLALYSLIFWVKDCTQSCVTNATPWYDALSLAGDADAMTALAQKLDRGMNKEGVGSDPEKAGLELRVLLEVFEVLSQLSTLAFHAQVCCAQLLRHLFETAFDRFCLWPGLGCQYRNNV
ncbi:unnamed protein product, partial [Polarella glacialis]